MNCVLKKSEINLSPDQIATSSPCNTYENTGLPPTPINQPGEAAMQAALTPDEGDWLYFVSVNPTPAKPSSPPTTTSSLKFKAEFEIRGGEPVIRQAAVIGSPIAHSLSPALHSAAYEALKLDWTYERHEVAAAELPAFVDGLDKSWVGLADDAVERGSAATGARDQLDCRGDELGQHPALGAATGLQHRC